MLSTKIAKAYNVVSQSEIRAFYKISQCRWKMCLA